MSCARDTVPSSNPMSSSVHEGHRSVLLHEAITALALTPGDTVLDATLGGAGHALAIAQALGPRGHLVGLDADGEAIERAQERLQDVSCEVTLIEANFKDATRELSQHGITAINSALFDLGWSSYHLSAGRGFSFREVTDPLLMTYEKDPGEDALTAKIILNTWESESIADILWGWGEERFSRRIARAIVERRTEAPLETVGDLVSVVESAVPAWYRRGRIHPATKTFQALRIATNGELQAAETGITAARDLLVPGGRLAVITFHSIEDRLIKQMFKRWEGEGHGTICARIKPTPEESKENPRARSALLRTFEKHHDE